MAALTDDAVLAALRAHPRAKAEVLTAALGVNQSTISRVMKRLAGRVIVRGRASRTRYAALGAVRGQGQFPLFRLDEHGRGNDHGVLECVAPTGTAVDGPARATWPADDAMRDGWYDGLPYWMLDMAPQGFLGRQFARAHSLLLRVPEDPSAWSDDDILSALSLLGDDTPGDLILGEAAYRRFEAGARQAEARLIDAPHVAEAYAGLAAQSLADGVAGSSAGGEFPKFTAARIVDGEVRHVIVKFSGADAGAAAVQRWSDLLVCEHLAARTLRATEGFTAAQTRVHRDAGRTFLEIERFDRHGLLGRSPLCSLEALNGGLIGAGAPLAWPALARRLEQIGALAPEDGAAVDRLWWFGRLIANTDMHLGNLSFAPGLAPRPAYDMLPMLYAPTRSGELPAADFTAPAPLPTERAAWTAAAAAARTFWMRCAADTRISEAFRRVCEANGRRVAERLDAAGTSAQ
jgi:DNA-binding transcriptional ArsR family regulator